MTAAIAALSRLLDDLPRTRLDVSEQSAVAKIIGDLLSGRSVCLRSDQPRLVRRRRLLADLAAACGCTGQPAAAADKIRPAAVAFASGEHEVEKSIAEALALLIELSGNRVPSRTSIYEDLRRSF